MREPAVGNTIAVAIAIGCTFVIGGCATATGGDTEGTAAASEEYLFKEPLKSGCVKQRRTGTRIPRCSRDAGIYSKAYHAPGREVDDRAN
ncbi:MAG: hypothetical protein AAGA61_10225 [Pseudomonadota bacterium]